MPGIPEAGQPDASSPDGHSGKAEPQPMNLCPGLQSIPASSRENTSTATDGVPNMKHSPFLTAATPQQKCSSEYKVVQQSSMCKKRGDESACAAGAQQRSLNTGRRGAEVLPPCPKSIASWKHCKRCNCWKLRKSDFTKNSRTPDGLQFYCRTCHNKMTRQHQAKRLAAAKTARAEAAARVAAVNEAAQQAESEQHDTAGHSGCNSSPHRQCSHPDPDHTTHVDHEEQEAAAAARAPASPMLATSAGMQGSQRVFLEQYWLGRHPSSGSGQMHPDAGSAEEGGMHAALLTEQSGAEAWGAAPGLQGAPLEPTGACSRESRLSQLTLAGDQPAAGDWHKGRPPAGQPWRTRCPECQRLQDYDRVWQQADADGSEEVAHLACCRGCRPQSEAWLASLGRDQAASQPEVSSSGTSSGSADGRGRTMKRQASRLPVPQGRIRDPAGFQGEHSAEAMTAASLQEPAMLASGDAGLDVHTQADGSRPGGGGPSLDAVALLRELQKRNMSPQSAAAGAEGLSNPFESVMRAPVKTEEPSAKRFKEGSPMKGFGSLLLGSSGSRLPLSLQASLSSSELRLPSKEPSAMDFCRNPQRTSSPVPAVAHSEPVCSLPPRVSIPLPSGPGHLTGLHSGASRQHGSSGLPRQQEVQPALEPTSTVDLALMTLLRAERVTLQHLQALLTALIQTDATEMWVQAVSMLSQHLDKARQETRTLREAPATRLGDAGVLGRAPLPGLAPSASVPVPAAAGMGSLWGSSAPPAGSGVGAAARQGWHLQPGQREELQRVEAELTAAAAQQDDAEQATEGSASRSGQLAKHLQAAAASIQRLLAVTPHVQQPGAGQEGQLAQPRLQLQSTQSLGCAAAASAQPAPPEAGLSQGPQVPQTAEAAHGPQEGVAADSAATAAGDWSQSRQAADTHQPPGLFAAAAPPRQPQGPARQLPDSSSSAPSGALSSVLAGRSLQAPGQSGSRPAVKEQAATPADQIQDVNRGILELLKRVGANEVVQQIFGVVSDAFAQHQSRSLVAERQLLAAMAATQQQGAAQQEQLQAALGALSSMHRTVQAVLFRTKQHTVPVNQAPPPSEQHLELERQLSESESDRALLLQQLGLAQLKSSKLESEKDELAAQLKAAQKQLVGQQ